MKQLVLLLFALFVFLLSSITYVVFSDQQQVSAYEYCVSSGDCVNGRTCIWSEDTGNLEAQGAICTNSTSAQCVNVGDCIDNRRCIRPSGSPDGVLEPIGENCGITDSSNQCVNEGDCINNKRCIRPSGSPDGVLEPIGESCNISNPYIYCVNSGDCVNGRTCIWSEDTGRLEAQGALCSANSTNPPTNDGSSGDSSNDGGTSGGSSGDSSNDGGTSGGSSGDSSGDSSSGGNNTSNPPPVAPNPGPLPPSTTVVPPPNIAMSDNQIPIVIRTYFTVEQFPGEGPVEVALYLNNGAGYDTSAHPYDNTACVSKNAGIGCGTPNLYQDKLVENFQIPGNQFVKDITINASELVAFPYEGIGMTKLSYVFHNDKWVAGVGDRNVYIDKIEVFGPVSEKLREFKHTDKSYFGKTADATGIMRDSFYFDKGLVDINGVTDSSQNGMVKAFDKQELATIQEMNVASAGRWILGTEGSFNIVTSDLHRLILQKYGGLMPASCVIATNDQGALPLRHNQELTLSSAASVEVEEFIYAFYNLDNKDANGTPKAYCIKGLEHTENCPAGSGQLRLKTSQPASSVQSISLYTLPNGQLSHGMWMNDQGWTKHSANRSWIQSDITGLPGSGEVRAQDAIPTKTGVQVYFWRDSVGYFANVPYTADKSAINFSGIALQKTVDLKENPTVFPGFGQVTAQTSIVVGDKFHQFIWRQDGRGFYRELPINSQGLPNYAGVDQLANHGFTYSNRVDNLPGDGKLQAIDLRLNSNKDQVIQTIWRGNQQWQNSFPITNGKPQFNNASEFTQANLVLPTSDSAGSYVVKHADVTKPDENNGQKIPQKLQVNAWFKISEEKTITSHRDCVTSFQVDNSIKGDFNRDCKVNLGDFNEFRNSFKKFNCNVNLMGDDCYIYLEDFNEFRAEYGKTCNTATR